MDHRATLNRIIIRVAFLSEVMPAVLAATEESPLRSTPVDAGSRPIGSHSDPTPSNALRRRRNDERRRWDRMLQNMDDLTKDGQKDAHQLLKRPSKIARCLVCVANAIPVIPVTDDSDAPAICEKCLVALNKACNRARGRGEPPVDRIEWVRTRHEALKARATATTSKGS